MGGNRVQAHESQSEEFKHLRFLRDRITAVSQECEDARIAATEAVARHERLKSKLGELNKQEAFWASELGQEPVSEADEEPEESEGPTGVSAKSEKPLHAKAARRILLSLGIPLKAPVIVRQLWKSDHPLPEDEAAATGAIYSAMLRRPKEFRRIGGGYWGLVGRDDHHTVESAARANARQESVNGVG